MPEKIIEDSRIILQQELADHIFRMVVEAPEIAKKAKPGQFVQIRIMNSGFLLRRPLGIAEADKGKGTLAFIYRVVGSGTKAMSKLKADTMINVLGSLGHGFDMKAKKPLIVGGGMGLSPLLFYATAMNGKADILMGGKTKEELFWQNLFVSDVQEMFCTTDDGSFGIKGFTTMILPELLKKTTYDIIVSCGPEIMMKEIAKISKEYGIRCQVSLEKRMGCGLGACLSCSIDTTDGKRKKVCKDGPVFEAEEVFA